MSFAEAGDILLTNRNPDITLGFVSAVQRGYDVCVSRVLPAPAPNGDATTASGDPAEQSASAAASCSKRSAGAANSPAAGSPDSRASNDSILARLDAEITQLRKGENTSPELSSESSSKSASQTSSGAGGAFGEPTRPGWRRKGWAAAVAARPKRRWRWRWGRRRRRRTTTTTTTKKKK